MVWKEREHQQRGHSAYHSLNTHVSMSTDKNRVRAEKLRISRFPISSCAFMSESGLE